MIAMQPDEVSATGGGPTAYVTRMAHVRDSLLDFFDHESIYVVRFVMRCGASLHEAEDAVQEAFIDAWALTAPPCRWAEVVDPRGWIRTVALRKFRRPPGPRKRPISVSVADLPEIPQLGTSHAELTDGTLLVLDALRSLDPKMQAVMAFHLDGFSGPEIAVELGITHQKVRDLLKKARKILAGQLAGIGDLAPGGREDRERRRTR
jgi:RNA polymerase sigma factor (sigma-70 family)